MQRFVLVLMVLGALAAWGFHVLRADALTPEAHVAMKGAAVALLALAALAAQRGRDGTWLAGVLAAGSLGDVLLEYSTTAGALAFMLGHVLAVGLYWKHGSRSSTRIAMIAGFALVVAAAAWEMPGNRSRAAELALYAAFVGAMAGAAITSGLPRRVGLGAALFLVSDLLIFAKLGPLAESALPGQLIWPLYFAGQWLICSGMLAGIQPAMGKRTEPSEARSSGP